MKQALLFFLGLILIVVPISLFLATYNINNCSVNHCTPIVWTFVLGLSSILLGFYITTTNCDEIFNYFTLEVETDEEPIEEQTNVQQ